MTCGKVRDIGSEAADRGDRPAVDLLAIALLWSMEKVVDSVANELRDRPSQARGDFFQSLGLLLRQLDLPGDHDPSSLEEFYHRSSCRRTAWILPSMSYRWNTLIKLTCQADLSKIP